MKKKIEEPVNHTKDERVNPYKGLHSYEETDADVFYGRTEDSERLFQLIRHNLLTVLIGKSGIGKTSLLNAGVFPKLRKESYLPIRVRLNYAADASPLLDQIRQAIRESKIKVLLKETDKPASPFAGEKDQTLWEFFHTISECMRYDSTDPGKSKTVIPVLVFDQFEEIFTVGKHHPDRERLIDEIYWLIEDQLPPSFKEKLSKARKKDKGENMVTTSTSRPDFRVVISLREDYLAFMTELKERIASINRNLFRVVPLNGRQAREIIGMPGGLKDEKAINNILNSFYPYETIDYEVITDERLEIEPALLSLICYEIFEKTEKVEFFSREDRERILVNFYESAISECPKKVKVEKFIENNLLTEEGRFRRQYPLEPDHPLKDPIYYLIEKRILRKDYVGNRESIEIIHDVLAPVIAEKRNKRLTRKKFRLFVSVAATLLLIITGYAINQTIRANKQARIAQVNWLTTEALLGSPGDNTSAVRIAAAAFEKGLPHPPARTCRVLSDIGCSSYATLFYTADLDHGDSIYSATFSPDSKTILTAGEDGKAKLWNLDGKSVDIHIQHDARIMSAAFSPDCKYILTGSWDKTAKLWNLQGKLLNTIKHDGPVTFGAFSVDGSLILTASRDNSARLWNLEGKMLTEFKHDGAVSSVVFSPDNKQILTASWDKTGRLWDTSGNLLKTFRHDGAVESALFSPDGKSIITASWDRSAKVWDQDGKLFKSLNHDGAVLTALFSNDGARILTASRDKSARVWDMQGNLKLNLSHDEPVSFAKFSSDGRYILIVSGSKAQIWNREGKLLSELTHNEAIKAAVFSGDGQWLVTASEDGTAKLWNLENKIITDLVKHTDAVKTALFSPDCGKILTASNDNTAKLWSGDKEPVELKHSNILLSAIFSPDGRMTLTASMDGTAKLWDMNGNLKAKLSHSGAVSYADFSPDSKYILTVSFDGAARLWNQAGKALRKINSDEIVTSAGFSPDSSQIITTSDNASPKVWSLEGERLLELKNDVSATFALFSPDGQKVATISRENSAKIWTRDGKLLVVLKHNDAISSIVFSSDSRMILTASEAGIIGLWNLEGKSLAGFKHEGAVTSAIFSPDNQSILTASKDGTARLWNLQGELLANLDKHKGPVNSAVFSPDGSRILTASDDKTAKVWLTPDAIYKWLQTAKVAQLSTEEKKRLGIE